MKTANPFERGRTQRQILDDISDNVGEDYPLLGLISELIGAIERDMLSKLSFSLEEAFIPQSKQERILKTMKES